MARNESSRRRLPGRMWGRAFWHIVLSLLLMVSAVIVILAIVGAFFDSTASSFASLVTFLVWHTYGPHLVMISLVVLAVSGVGLQRGPGRLTLAGTIMAAAALLASTIITTQIVLAAYAAGGSAKPISGLWLLPINSPSPDSTETYTTIDGQPLTVDIYRPGNTTNTAPILAPMLVYIHGGGWYQGSSEQVAYNLRWFADRGWLVISIQYRLATASQPTWDLAPQDVACALVWATENATRLGGDTDHLVIVGDSAGGNLAINLAYSAAIGQAESGCGGHVPIPDAVVAQYPVVDPQDAYDNGLGVGDSAPQKFIPQYLGGTPQEFPDRLEAISSATYLSDQAPPTLIIEPEKDGLIPTSGVLRWVEQARAAGVDINLVIVPFANHAYDVTFGNAIGNQARLTITQHYLEQRGLVESQR